MKPDIAKTIAKYVALTYKGNKAIGLCPFHNDKNPSLQVNLIKQTFICYACGEKGDVYTFIQKIENCTFKQALEKLGETPTQSNSNIKKKRNYPLSIVHCQLKSLLPYSTGNSDLSAAYLDFEVGIAPHLLPKEWNYLAGRIVFPIKDENGKTVGYSGRAINNQPGPKYLNTPAQYGYKRNQIVYGYYKAKQTIQQTGEAILTEGYKDCIAMHAAGFTNTVAIMGTFLSEEQTTLILKNTNKIILLLDTDEAGEKAMVQIENDLKKQKPTIEIIKAQLPQGKDPDALFRESGKTEFIKQIETLINPPHHTENALVEACLLHPNATIFHPNENQNIFMQITTLLETEKIEFTSPIHQEIFNTNKTKNSVNNTLPKTEPHANEQLKYLLLLFLDKQITTLINQLKQILRQALPPTQRTEILQQINLRKEQTEEISKRIEYTGYIK